MTEIRIQTVAENDGELHLRSLPCRKGDHIYALVTIAPSSITTNTEEDQRELARQQFLAIARTSRFKSDQSYPSRDDLHARD